jgi:hypothetical protein
MIIRKSGMIKKDQAVALLAVHQINNHFLFGRVQAVLWGGGFALCIRCGFLTPYPRP